MNKLTHFLITKSLALQAIKDDNERREKCLKAWKENNDDIALMAGREARYFGDPVFYDAELHTEINALLFERGYDMSKRKDPKQ